MFHQRFDAQIKGKPKRIGILGERHLYNDRESSFARNIVRDYDNFGAEKCAHISTFEKSLITVAGLTFIPYALAHYLKHDDLSEDAEDYAKRVSKNIIPLDVMVNPLKVLGLSLYTLAVSPILIPRRMFESKEENLRKRMNKEDLLIKGEKRGSLMNFLGDVDKRDAHMAKTAYDFLSHDENNNLLINCGMNHVPGIRRNLEKLTEKFELVSTERCYY